MGSPKTPSRDHVRLMTKVARLYHERGVRQPQIAADLSITQTRVSRLLKEAAERGIVRTIVVAPPGVHSELEDWLKQEYDLRDAMVVDVERATGDVVQALGAGAATYLDASIVAGEVIGVSSWSASLLAAVEVMQPRRGPFADRVVQASGGVGTPEVQLRASHLTSRLAELTGADPVFVPSPWLVGSPTLQQALLADRGVSEVAAMWGELTLTLVGIGTMEPSPMLRRSGNSLSDDDLARLREAGAVGDVCLRYFDAEGRPVVSDLDDRVIGIDRDDLLRVPRRVGVAGGLAKVDAIEAALRGRWVNVLVTDLEVAQALRGRA